MEGAKERCIEGAEVDRGTGLFSTIDPASLGCAENFKEGSSVMGGEFTGTDKNEGAPLASTLFGEGLVGPLTTTLGNESFDTNALGVELLITLGAVDVFFPVFPRPMDL